jgi:hypothetical protein
VSAPHTDCAGCSEVSPQIARDRARWGLKPLSLLSLNATLKGRSSTVALAVVALGRQGSTEAEECLSTVRISASRAAGRGAGASRIDRSRRAVFRVVRLAGRDAYEKDSTAKKQGVSHVVQSF